MKIIGDQINVVRKELEELEATLPDWKSNALSAQGSKKYRSISRRVVLSTQYLEQLVKENTF